MFNSKKIFCLFLCLTLFLTISGAAIAEKPSLELKTEGAILIEATTGEVIYEQNPHVQWAPASVTKVMTMLLAIEAVKQGKVSLDDMVLASDFACSFGGSQVYLEPGEKFTLHEMLLAIAVGSANDGSVSVAEHIAGSYESFVKAMNDKAKELGLENTNFVNTHGLDDEQHYTSPYDMVIISRYLINNYPEILDYTGVKMHVFREEPLLELYNTNKLLWWYDGADGLKTGFTSSAKRNLASTVKKDGLRLIAVVMGVEEKHGHFRESIKLYNYGFSQFAFKCLYEEGQEVLTIPVSKGLVDQIGIIAENKVGYVIRKGEKDDGHIVLEVPQILEAPIEKGQVVGQIVVMRDNKEVARGNLVAPHAVEKASYWRQMLKLLSKVY